MHSEYEMKIDELSQQHEEATSKLVSAHATVLEGLREDKEKLIQEKKEEIEALMKQNYEVEALMQQKEATERDLEAEIQQLQQAMENTSMS